MLKIGEQACLKPTLHSDRFWCCSIHASALPCCKPALAPASEPLQYGTTIAAIQAVNPDVTDATKLQ